MKCHLKKSIVFVSYFSVLLCCSHAIGFDESRLWLAQSHHKFYIPLLKAAGAAESIDRCVEVLEGTLDISQSEPDKPIFRIMCRQENGRSYNEMVDGTTFDTLTTPKVIPVELTAEEMEQLRLQEEERQRLLLQQRKQSLWQMCDQSIQNRSKMMVDFTWVSPSNPEPLSIDDESAVFEVYFDAKNMWGHDLHYKANCKVAESGVISVDVSKK